MKDEHPYTPSAISPSIPPPVVTLTSATRLPATATAPPYPPPQPTLTLNSSPTLSATPTIGLGSGIPLLTLTPILYSLDSYDGWFDYEYPEFNFKIKYPLHKPKVNLGTSYQIAEINFSILTRPYTNHPAYHGNPVYIDLNIFDNSGGLTIAEFIDQWQAGKYGLDIMERPTEEKALVYRSHLAEIGAQEARIYFSLYDPRPWVFISFNRKIYLFGQGMEHAYDPLQNQLFGLIVNSFYIIQN